jgi:hypothetical protein
MTAEAKDRTLKVLLGCIAMAVIALALLIPGVVVYKLVHGASGLSCAAILAGYAANWAALLLLLARYHKRSATWGILFGLCFYGLLFLSWRL